MHDRFGIVDYAASLIGNPPLNKMVVFKMRDSVPSARYSPICNVLRQWKTSLIPIYRVYRLYDKYYESVFRMMIN